ncbi:hypothetical protein NP233_g3852 [Leucocoprinus birnbaumii]|uniref:Uncharacterized protein n=1 Tax=Leucocoprinus birnbaumii TaxID=56174 RepID=A0AAD5VYF9_9AGAR|nr:hypothetical protein NP233_g3852 [Leucocoprinus birnbaumii]
MSARPQSKKSPAPGSPNIPIGPQPSKQRKKPAKDKNASHLDSPQVTPTGELNEASIVPGKIVARQCEDKAGDNHYFLKRQSFRRSLKLCHTFDECHPFDDNVNHQKHSRRLCTINVVIQRLVEKGAPAAIHNSAYRAYPPRCHEETRQSMRTDIGPWTADPKRLRRVAMSAAEELDLLERLGATTYFSCPGKIDDPDTVIPTPASQLATKNTRYKHLITLAIGNDPLILSLAFILRFINDDDGDNDDPSARFGLCARVIRGVGIGAETANPLELLDSLHRQVLSRVTSKRPPQTMHILGFSVLYPSYSTWFLSKDLSALEQASMLLDMPLDSSYRYLK